MEYKDLPFALLMDELISDEFDLPHFIKLTTGSYLETDNNNVIKDVEELWKQLV